MNIGAYKLSLDLNFIQILELVKQLPLKQKITLTRELTKDTIDYKLTEFLETFKTDELSQETIDEEVEKVRKELYEKEKTL